MTAVHREGLSKKHTVPAVGTLQLLCLKSLPDVQNGVNIPGMSSLLASSITVLQAAPLRTFPNPQPCLSARDASSPADGLSAAQSLSGRRQDS